MAPLSIASVASNSIQPLPPTSDTEVCFSNLNRAFAQQTPLTLSQRAKLLAIAESSKAYQAFAQAHGTPSSGDGVPAIDYHTAPGCSGIIIGSFDFNFVAGGKELTVAVSPSSLTVVGTMTLPMYSWGVSQNVSGIWGGGYGFWNGST